MAKHISKITALVGGAFGSEGKGVVAKWVADEYEVSVRTGGPNAGHTFAHKGKIFKQQSLPCGWTNPRCQLVIGAGAIVNLKQLKKEIEKVAQVDPEIWDRVWIDHRAMILTAKHHEEEGGTKGEFHARIGSTGEGVGAARIDRIRRNPDVASLVEGNANFKMGPKTLGDMTIDTVARLHDHIEWGHNIMLEGTQGYGLSLVHGPWPYVTSHDTNAATLAADAGIPPHWVTDVIMVVRTFPIRVAGNSGPLKGETSWAEISKRLGKKVEETTTVTKKTRRVGVWDDDLMRQAMRVNAPTSLALTFIDYLNPKDEYVTEFSKLSEESRSFVDYIERYWQTPVHFIGTGFNGNTKEGWSCIDRRDGGKK